MPKAPDKISQTAVFQPTQITFDRTGMDRRFEQEKFIKEMYQWTCSQHTRPFDVWQPIEHADQASLKTEIVGSGPLGRTKFQEIIKHRGRECPFHSGLYLKVMTRVGHPPEPHSAEPIRQGRRKTASTKTTAGSSRKQYECRIRFLDTYRSQPTALQFQKLTED